MSEMISIKEAAERWKLTVRRVSTLCKEGKVEGAIPQPRCRRLFKNRKIVG